MKKSIYSKEHGYMVQQLKRARKEAGLDQKSVARILRRTQSYVSRIESGQRRIDVVQLKAFGKIYSKTLDFFIKKEKVY